MAGNVWNSIQGDKFTFVRRAFPLPKKALHEFLVIQLKWKVPLGLLLGVIVNPDRPAVQLSHVQRVE